MSSQMSGMPADNFMQPYPYDSQSAQGTMHSQMPVHDQPNHQMYMNGPKQEMDTSQRQYQSFVSMSAPNTPSTPRTNGTNQNTPQTQNTAPERNKTMDTRPPAFTTSSFHAAPFQPGAIRRRRNDALGFPVDAGPFFSPTKQHYNVYSMDRTNSYKLRINSKVDRGFFLADNDWTCYRRNYFQISSAFSITGTNHPVSESETPCLIEVDGQFHTATQFLLGITARVSNSDKKIELVQHTPKRDKGPQMVPVPKPIRAGGNLNLSSVGSNSNIVTFERIQFKTATANNGKRRAAQQYYVILVDLYAQVENGEQYRVATSTSAALVVRGRSPGHYADNHDRYNPMSINSAFPPNDRHMGFPHPQSNGAPGVMTSDFGGAPFPPYGQYPPFPGFQPVQTPNPMRNDALSLIMTSAPNSQNPPFHPQPPHQPYMVPSISEVPPAESTNPEMYNNPNIDPNNLTHDQKIQQIPPHHQHHQQVGMEMHNMDEYVEGFNMYPNSGGHSSNNASQHHGGYQSDNEHHNTGYQHQANGRSSPPSQQTRSDANGAQNSNGGHHHPAAATTSPQLNGATGDRSPNNGNIDRHGSKSPISNASSHSTPTSELGKNLGQLNMTYRLSKIEESEKL